MPERVRAVGGGAVEAVRTRLSRRARKAEQPVAVPSEEPEEPDPDWWTRYYATVQARAADVRLPRTGACPFPVFIVCTTDSWFKPSKPA